VACCQPPCPPPAVTMGEVAHGVRTAETRALCPGWMVEGEEEEEGEAIGPRSSGWAMVVRAACSNALQVPLWHCSLLLLLFFKTYHGRG
jgi:hypothetical protein